MVIIWPAEMFFFDILRGLPAAAARTLRYFVFLVLARELYYVIFILHGRLWYFRDRYFEEKVLEAILCGVFLVVEGGFLMAVIVKVMFVGDLGGGTVGLLVSGIYLVLRRDLQSPL